MSMPSTESANNGFGKLKEFVIPIGVLLVLTSILFPIPSALLDCLLVLNLIIAIGLLITTLSISDPLKLSTLPTLLLLATMYRLALNISTTRLILGNGYAGAMIEAFGHLVIQGNLVVGAVVFLVITLVQFIVIAKGSERVAEVAARFTLDALPGKQMSIDADVRAGLIDHNTARLKRDELQCESRFYGALDGAMKFVKGDAIAALVIVAINLVAGIVVGVLFQKMNVATSVSHFSILTIGDGLSAQIPALLNSLAAGIVVTRVVKNDDSSVSAEILSQLGQSARVFLISAGFALLLALLPEMPKIPLTAMAAVMLFAAFSKSAAKPEVVEQIVFQPRLPVSLSLQANPEFLGEFVKAGGISALEYWRTRIFEDTGLILARPEIFGSNSSEASANILFRSMKLTEITPATNLSTVELVISGFDHAVEFLKDELIDDQLTRRLLDHLDNFAPELVSSAIPNIVSTTQLTEILKGLRREGLSIRNFDLILQAISLCGTRNRNERGLLAEVRVALKRQISNMYADKNRQIAAFSIDSSLDLAIGRYDREGTLLDSKLIQDLAETVKHLDHPKPLIICSRAARACVREFLDMHELSCAVMAYEEIAEGFKLMQLGRIESNAKNYLLQEMAA